MQFIAGILTTVVIALVMGFVFGWGLLPMLVALGLGLVSYGLVDIRIRKGAGDEPR